eukprot:9401741-Pyramimonas_sp.AAC.1
MHPRSHPPPTSAGCPNALKAGHGRRVGAKTEEKETLELRRRRTPRREAADRQRRRGGRPHKGPQRQAREERRAGGG